MWNWRQSNVPFPEIACREVLRRLAAKELIELPEQFRAARRARYRNRFFPRGVEKQIPISFCRVIFRPIRLLPKSIAARVTPMSQRSAGNEAGAERLEQIRNPSKYRGKD